MASKAAALCLRSGSSLFLSWAASSWAEGVWAVGLAGLADDRRLAASDLLAGCGAADTPFCLATGSVCTLPLWSADKRKKKTHSLSRSRSTTEQRQAQ